MTEPFPFLTDILSQPKGLEDVIAGYDPRQVEPLRQRLQQGDFDRVVLTGMGASAFGTYPAWLHLAQAGLPAFWIDTSELLYYTPGLITPRTLLWVVSNSGKSIEITRLLSRLDEFGRPFVLANTNLPESPLARRASQVVPLYTGSDLTLSTRSYLGTLAVTQLIALGLAGKSVEPELKDLRVTAAGIRAYCDRWQAHLKTLDEQIGRVERIGLVGRGPSFATAVEGALALKEGAKINAEGFTTGQFWHGPIELLDPSYTLLMLGGEAVSRAEDETLAASAAGLGARVFWLSRQPAPNLPALDLPDYAGIGLPLAEILPIQLMAMNIARQTGFPTLAFRYLNTRVHTKDETFPA